MFFLFLIESLDFWEVKEAFLLGLILVLYGFLEIEEGF